MLKQVQHKIYEYLYYTPHVSQGYTGLEEKKYKKQRTMNLALKTIEVRGKYERIMKLDLTKRCLTNVFAPLTIRQKKKSLLKNYHRKG